MKGRESWNTKVQFYLLQKVQSPLRKREGEETKKSSLFTKYTPLCEGKERDGKSFIYSTRVQSPRGRRERNKTRVYIQEYNRPKGRGESNVTRVEFY